MAPFVVVVVVVIIGRKLFRLSNGQPRADSVPFVVRGNVAECLPHLLLGGLLGNLDPHLLLPLLASSAGSGKTGLAVLLEEPSRESVDVIDEVRGDLGLVQFPCPGIEILGASLPYQLPEGDVAGMGINRASCALQRCSDVMLCVVVCGVVGKIR